jgi:hypothetical protein
LSYVLFLPSTTTENQDSLSVGELHTKQTKNPTKNTTKNKHKINKEPNKE